jgi:hypothetical protein
MIYHSTMTQVLTVSCKLKVSQSQATKLDATMNAFVQALNWVKKRSQRRQTAIPLLLRDSYSFRAV